MNLKMQQQILSKAKHMEKKTKLSEKNISEPWDNFKYKSPKDRRERRDKQKNIEQMKNSKFDENFTATDFKKLNLP